MLASTTFDIPGYEIIEHRGLVRGIIVRSPTIAQDILASSDDVRESIVVFNGRAEHPKSLANPS